MPQHLDKDIHLTLHNPLPERFLSVEGVCLILGIGRTKFYALVKAGHLDVIKLGRRSLIDPRSLERFVSSLPLTSFKKPKTS